MEAAQLAWVSSVARLARNRDRAPNTKCRNQHTAVMVSVVERQSSVTDPEALTAEDKPSATTSDRG